ncbi:MAG: hypothetical protein O3B41_11650 [Bacteroidetes bacterium]|nr:hypothetical protein [Bacteroidota bacterium]
MNSLSPRVLIVVNVFRPDLGGGVLFADLCDGLYEKGFDVFVKCAYPYYPQWSDVSGKNGLRISTDTSNGYTVERHGIYIPSNPGSLLQRLIYEASFFLSLVRRIPKKGDYDAIMVFSPLIGSVGYAALVSKLTKIPVWLNVQDLSAQAAAAGGIASGNHGASILERIQNWLFKKCHFWSSISEPMVGALQSIGGAPLVHLIPNWMHASLALEIERARVNEKEITQSEQPLRLLYSGNVGGKQDLVQFCRLLHDTTTSFRFRIQAAGARLDELRAWIEEVSDPRFELHDLTDEAGLAQELINADFYVITEKPGSGNSFIPSKLIPSISSGTPILAVCDAEGPLGREVVQYNLGACLEWGSSKSFEPFLDNIVQDLEQRSTWKRSALERSAFYNRASGISRCAEALGKVAAIDLSRN